MDTAKRKERQKTTYERRQFRQGPRWATVTKCLGNVMYIVQLEEQADVTWRRHANQLRTRIVPVNIDTDNPDTSDDSARSVVDTPQILPNSQTHSTLGSRALSTGGGDVVFD